MTCGPWEEGECSGIHTEPNKIPLSYINECIYVHMCACVYSNVYIHKIIYKLSVV